VGKEGVGEEGSGARFLAYLDTLMSIADAHFMSEMAEDENSLQDEHSASLLTFQDGLYPGVPPFRYIPAPRQPRSK